MELVIPKKIKKRKSKKSNEYYHYDLVKVYSHHIVYKCEETSKLESFSKNDFIKGREENKYDTKDFNISN